MRLGRTREPREDDATARDVGRPGGREPAVSQAMFRRFVRAWIPGIAVLIVLELIGAPLTRRPELLAIVALTAIAGVAVFAAALGLSRQRASRLPILAAVIADVAAVATALLSAAGNDAAIMLPYIGAVLLVGTLEDRELLLAFAIQWLVGVIGAVGAFGFSSLRNVPDADPFYVSVAAAGVITAVGYTLLWWVREGLNRAVHRAREAEQAARRNAQALEAIVRGSPVPTIGFGLDGVIRTWNPAAERVFGRPVSDVVGMDVSSLAIATDGVPPLNPVEHVLRGDVVSGLRVGWRGRDDETLAVDLYAALLEDAEGRPSGVVAQAIDETEREALRVRLAGAERLEAVGRLAGGIAHDFNNLLMAIAGYAELLETDLDDADPRRKDAAEIRRAAGRGTELVRQLLAFGRRQPIRPVALDLGELVDGVVPMLGRLIGSGVRIRVERDPIPCFVRADPGQMEQVIVNLAVNARDAMPEGGDLVIRTEAVGGGGGPRVRLTVSDTGMGMDASMAARIFEPFFSTKPSGHGNGLGLATVYGVVTAHGGVIEVRSRPGEGATFVVELSRVSPPAVPPTGAVGTQWDGPAGRSETVLVLDDEDQVRRVAARALERIGYRVLEAGDRDTAVTLAAAEAGRIDLVLSDVVMPDARGPVVVEALRALHPEMRTLYMTGYAPDGQPATDQQALDSPVLAKPFSLADLAASVRRTLDGPAG
jgi:two-component system cell cycle sensor histidine kinase/response regulator CckA